MAGEQGTLDRLRAALSELAAREVPSLMQEATEVARERVRQLLTEALSESLLSAVQDELDGEAIRPGAAAEDIQTARTPDRDGAALYVYGVVGAHDAERPELAVVGASGAERSDYAAAGAGRGPLRAVIDGELAALTAEVPLSEFDEARLREHLADMAWVEATARHHEQVLETIGEAATVVPMRMCTVYGSEEGIRELLRREERPLRDALHYLAGRREWGVKVFCDPAAVAEESTSSAGRGESGADYIQHRLRERDERAGAAERIDVATERIHEQLCTVAVDSHLTPTQRPEVSGRRAEMVLNGVYLVPVEAEPRFHAQIRALAKEFAELGLDLEATGPWPAYNFVPGAIGAGW